MRYVRVVVALAFGLGLVVVLALVIDSPRVSWAAPRVAPGVLYVSTTGRDFIPRVGPNPCTDKTDPCQTVQHAVDVSDPYDEVRVMRGEYTGVQARAGVTQVLYISAPVTIRGGYGPGFDAWDPMAYSTTLDAGGHGRVFTIDDATQVTLESLRMTNGRYMGGAQGGAVRVEGATIAISGCEIFSNTASCGVRVFGGPNSDFINNHIFNNTGSGLYVSSSYGPDIIGNRIHGNTAYCGGWMGVSGCEDALIVDNEVYSNTAYHQQGGGLYIINSPHTSLIGNQISGNRTLKEEGGGLYLIDSPYATLEDNAFYSNTANSLGGGIYMDNCPTSTLRANLVYSNVAQWGGGLSLWQIHNSLLWGHRIVGNEADQDGAGAMLCQSHHVTLTNNIVADNRGPAAGAGLYLQSARATLLHTTVARNRGEGGEGVYLADDAEATMINTILVSNTVGVVVAADVGSPSYAYLTGTLWGTGAWANLTDATIDIGKIVTDTNVWGDPGFVDADGGDYHITPLSAARDAGVDAGVATDIDGEPRPQGPAPDIGADEVRTCYARLNDDSTDYETVQAAVDASTLPTDVVKVAGYCTNAAGDEDPDPVVHLIKTLTVRGGYNTDFSAWDPGMYPSTLDGLGQDRVVTMIGGEITPTLEALRLTRGWAVNDGGGIHGFHAHPTISDCEIFSNTAGNAGGGVYLDRGSGSLLVGNVFFSNTAMYGSGAYLYLSDQAVVTDNQVGRLRGFSHLRLASSEGVVVANNEIAGSADLISSPAATLTNNQCGGGVHLSSSPLATLANNDIDGGVGLSSSPTCTLAVNDIRGSYHGVRIDASGGALVKDNTIHDNAAEQGSGGICIDVSESHDVTIVDNECHDNISGWDEGGAISIRGSARALLSGNEIVSNTAYTYGGGIYISGCLTATVTGNTLYSNTARLAGGAAYIVESPGISVTDNLIHDNTTLEGSGGGIFIDSDHARVVGNQIVGNTAEGSGGGIFMSYGQFTAVEDNKIYSNSAQYDGGGIYCFIAWYTRLAGNRIHGNSAGSAAAVTLNSCRGITVDNNIVWDNHASALSGAPGIEVYGTSGLLRHNTLAGNEGGDGSAISVRTTDEHAPGRVTLTNNILVGHAVGISVTAGSTATLEATLWGSAAWANEHDWGGDGAILTGTVNVWGDPAFVDALAGDYHIGPASAAIDAGIEASVCDDIDGDPRPQGPGPDIGADEYVARVYLPLALRGSG